MNAYCHLINWCCSDFYFFSGYMKSIHIRYIFDHLKLDFGHIFCLKRVLMLSFLIINSDEKKVNFEASVGVPVL